MSACLLVLSPKPAAAFELSGGVGLGVIGAGADPRLSVSPQAGIQWRVESGFSFGLENLLNIVPATDRYGVGVYDRTAIVVGYATENSDFGFGPSVSFFSMPACRYGSCGRASGTAPGAHAQASFYFVGPLGVSLSIDVDWRTGESLLVNGVVAATILAGPILRWRSK